MISNTGRSNVLRAGISENSTTNGRTASAPFAWWRSLASNRVLLGSLVMALAAFVGITFRTPGGCFLLWAVALAVGVLTNRSSDKNSVYRSPWFAVFVSTLIIPATAFWRFATIPSKSINALELAVDLLAHSSLAVALWIWSRNPQRGHVSLMVAMVLALFMSVASGGVSGLITGQTAIGLICVLGFMATSQIVLSPVAVSSNFRPGALLYSASAILAILMATSAMTQATTQSLSEIQDFISSGLKDQLEAGTSEMFGSGTRYVSGERLGSVRRTMGSNPQEIVLRGYSERVPGYLRGTVFDNYRNGAWDTYAGRSNATTSRSNQFKLGGSIVRPIAEASVPTEKVSRGRRMRYPIAPIDASIDAPKSLPPIVGTVEIISDPTRGNKAFLPEATVWVELVGRSVYIREDRTISRGVDFDAPYVAGVAAVPMLEKISATEREILIQVPEVLKPVIEKTAIEALGDDEARRDNPLASQKASKIANFFQSKFVYSLDRRRAPQWIDPLWYFLESRHPAHCEYFAAAGMFLLRSQGIPARYVTGYVMDEPSEDANSYVARNADAHAWVEYFDESESRWKVAEMTPGRNYTPFGQGAVEITGSSEGLVQTTEKIGTGFQFFQQMRRLLGVFPAPATVVVAFRYAQLPLLLLLSWLLYRRIRKPRIHVSTHAKRLQALDRKARRWGMVRESSETLHQFAVRIETNAPENPKKKIEWLEMAKAVADEYRLHARTLYRAI